MRVRYVEGVIREYDINAANISILAEKGYISETLYENLMDGDKEHRNIAIGKLIRNNSEVYTIIKEGIEQAVSEFKSVNRLNDEDILEVAKDAIFTINVKASSTKRLSLSFGDYINFLPKAVYSSVVEFNPSDSSSVMVKIYLDYNDNKVVVRYGTIDPYNELYGILVDLMRFMHESNRPKYMQSLRDITKLVRSNRYDKLISSVENERLLEMLRELATI